MSSVMESLRMALDGLLNNKIRSGLTMLGIIVGVGAVIAMVSLGQGFTEFVTGQFESLGTNLLSIRRDRSVDGALRLDHPGTADGEPNPLGPGQLAGGVHGQAAGGVYGAVIGA